MCEYHLKGQCFHPQKTQKGLVATECKFHDCSKCTNPHWQQQKIEKHYEYYQSILEITSSASQEKTKETKILSKA